MRSLAPWPSPRSHSAPRLEIAGRDRLPAERHEALVEVGRVVSAASRSDPQTRAVAGASPRSHPCAKRKTVAHTGSGLTGSWIRPHVKKNRRPPPASCTSTAITSSTPSMIVSSRRVARRGRAAGYWTRCRLGIPSETAATRRGHSSRLASGPSRGSPTQTTPAVATSTGADRHRAHRVELRRPAPDHVYDLRLGDRDDAPRSPTPPRTSSPCNAAAGPSVSRRAPRRRAACGPR